MPSNIYRQAAAFWDRFPESATLDDLNDLLNGLDELYFTETQKLEEEDEDGENN